MSDKFSNHQSSLNAPATSAFEILPDDVNPLPNVTRAIYVGGAGNLAITMLDGQTLTLEAVQPGAIYPLRCTHVRATGTTATGLAGLL